MALTMIITTLAILSTLIYLLMKWLDSRTSSAIALRNVRYIPQTNVFWSVFKKERTELTKDEILKREHVKVFGFTMMNAYTILCADPDIAGQVMSKEFTSFTNRRTVQLDDPVLSGFLSSALDEKWKRLRSIVTPTFSAGSLRRMKPRIDETVHTLLKHFEQNMAKSSEVDVKKLFGAFTMDTIIQVAFGTKVDSLNDPENPVILNARKVFSADLGVKQFASLMVLFTMPKLAKLMGISFMGEPMKFFRVFSEQIIKRKKDDLESNKDSFGKASSFIDLVLEAEAEFKQQESNGKEPSNGHANGHANGHTDTSSVKKVIKYMSTDEVLAQCMLFFLAGYDTTATTITLASYLLALHPEAQEKLYQEIKLVTEKLVSESDGSKDLVELITTESLPRFEYLTGVVNETLRLYAPASMTERVASKDMILVNSDGSVRIDLKKGDVMQFPIYSMHRDPEQFPEPEAFKPERFIGEPAFHKYSYLPFGSGPRNCVAKSLALMEAKLALLHTVRQFKFSRCEQTKVPFEMYYQNNFISPRDIILKVEKRV